MGVDQRALGRSTARQAVRVGAHQVGRRRHRDAARGRRRLDRSDEHRHVAYWESVKVVDRIEEEGERADTTVVREKERFSQRLTLLYADGRIELLSERPAPTKNGDTRDEERTSANGQADLCAPDAGHGDERLDLTRVTQLHLREQLESLVLPPFVRHGQIMSDFSPPNSEHGEKSCALRLPCFRSGLVELCLRAQRLELARGLHDG